MRPPLLTFTEETQMSTSFRLGKHQQKGMGISRGGSVRWRHRVQRWLGWLGTLVSPGARKKAWVLVDLYPTPIHTLDHHHHPCRAEQKTQIEKKRFCDIARTSLETRRGAICDGAGLLTSQLVVVVLRTGGGGAQQLHNTSGRGRCPLRSSIDPRWL